MVALGGPADELGEPPPQAGLAQHQFAYLLGGGADRGELLLHGLLERQLAGRQAGLDALPEVVGPVGRDDQVKRVPFGDRAVEIAGDEQGLHRFEATRDARVGSPYDPPVTVPRPIFIHGSGGDHRVWSLQTARLAGAVALDLPGHPDGDAATDIATLAGAVGPP